MRRETSKDRKPAKEFVQNYGECSCWGYGWKGNIAPENMTEVGQKTLVSDCKH